MFTDVDESQSSQHIGSVSMTSIDLITISHGILAFRAAAQGIELLKSSRFSRDRREKSQIRLGFDIERVAHFLFRRRARFLKGAFLSMEDPLASPIFACTWTGKEQSGFGGEIGLIAHAASSWAQGRAIGFKGQIGIHRDLGARGVVLGCCVCSVLLLV